MTEKINEGRRKFYTGLVWKDLDKIEMSGRERGREGRRVKITPDELIETTRMMLRAPKETERKKEGEMERLSR